MVKVSKLLLSLLAGLALAIVARVGRSYASGNINRLNHIIIVTQENHSFDNYFGTLPYTPEGPYHQGPCSPSDHSCVDGLACTITGSGSLSCTNSNLDDNGDHVSAFHEQKYCTSPDLDHSWVGSHLEGNFTFPNMMLPKSPNDGFVRQNDAGAAPDSGESADDDDTMGFYTASDLPFYYGLAESFAIDDRYFSSVAGPTMPNRSYELAATSFGHVSTAEIFPPPGGYKPLTGTIFDLLDQNHVSWNNYFINLPSSAIFRGFPAPHQEFIATFFKDAASGTLPAVSFVDSAFTFDGVAGNDEHPPSDIRAGEDFVSKVIKSIRNGPNWKDSIILLAYDEHGGFYDHVAPPAARQNGLTSPDGIDPGLCEDLSDPPASLSPGGGAECSGLPFTDNSFGDAQALCPLLNPGGPYPSFCANFNQLGFRVPFIAISPFSKPHYVSHKVGDHTSMLALIEERFMPGQHLTQRDANASTLEDMFDFNHSPSLDTPLPPDPPAASANDPGCA